MSEQTGAPQPLTEDDEDDVLNGPIAEFFLSHQVRKDKFGVMLKRQKAGAEDVVETLGSWPNKILDENAIGEMFGPGRYILSFTWYSKNMPVGTPRGERNRIEDYRFELPEYPWRGKHLKYRREELDREQAEEKERSATRLEEAKIESVRNGGSGQPVVSELETFSKAADKLRSLGVQIGGVQPAQNGINWEKILAMAAIIVPVVAPLFKRDDTLLLALLGKQTEKTPMEERMTGLMGTFMDMTERVMRLGGPAEEKESIADRIFGALETLGPPMLEAWSKKSQAELEKNFMYRKAVESPEFAEVKSNPKLLEELVNRFDEQYGYQQTEDSLIPLLAKMGLTRPEPTKANLEKFPSPGYDGAGNKIDSKA